MANFIGTNGNDHIDGTHDGDSIDGRGGNDLLVGDDGVDTILGGDGADTIHAGWYDDDDAQGDVLDGGGGADVIYAGDGDQLDGGDGVDKFVLYFNEEPTGLVDLSGFSTAQFVFQNGASVTNFESGSLLYNTTSDMSVTLGEAHIWVTAGSGDDTLTGGDSNDLLNGSEGDDVIIGGNGDDTLTGGFGDDTVSGGSGRDVISAYGADSLDAGADNDTMLASHLASGAHLDGGSGEDFIQLTFESGGPSDLSGITDGIFTSGGVTIENFERARVSFTDNLANAIDVGDAHHVTVFAHGGDDTILGGVVGAELYGMDGNDEIVARGGADLLAGGDGSDTLVGGKGRDTLSGGDQHDVLNGGQAADTLTGGQGRDTFLFKQLATLDGDLITDLTNDDKINLSHIDADTNTAGDQAFTLVSAFSGAAGELRVHFDGANTLFELDVDGDGSADAVLTATGDHGDFTNFGL